MTGLPERQQRHCSPAPTRVVAMCITSSVQHWLMLAVLPFPHRLHMQRQGLPFKVNSTIVSGWPVVKGQIGLRDEGNVRAHIHSAVIESIEIWEIMLLLLLLLQHRSDQWDYCAGKVVPHHRRQFRGSRSADSALCCVFTRLWPQQAVTFDLSLSAIDLQFWFVA